MLAETAKHFDWKGNLEFQEYNSCVILDVLDVDAAIDLR